MPNGARRIRKNVQTLGRSQDDLFWYAKAVADLRLRPVSDPTSWRYQAAVHGYNPDSDPNVGLPDPLPPPSHQERFWSQCQHQTWYFLPWHRGFLAYFEQIVAAAVVKAGGPQGWSLPYWNYSAHDPSSRLMPDAFVRPTLIDGTPNPLYVAGRNSHTSNFNLTDGMVSLECLTHSPFAGVASGGDPGFGGPRTRFSHFGGTSGRLEDVPHNVIHDRIGGLMGDPETAALDPIFWLHHANIDRLWEVWTHRNQAFVDPTDTSWQTGLTFELQDASGAVQTYTPAQMMVTTAVLDGYVYDDISDPVRANRALMAGSLRVETMASAPHPPQLTGTSQVPIQLTGRITSAEVVMDRTAVQSARQKAASLAPTRRARVFLNLENVTGSGRPGTYEVYIDAPPPGQQASPDKALYAGLLPTFGVEVASRPTGPQAGSGITTVLEITDQVEILRQQHRWDESRLQVLFVNEHPQDMQLAIARAAQANLKIGRISVYYH
jgi:tyrosinase